RPHQGFDPGPHRRVGEAELALHLAEVAARAQEALQQGQLLATEAAEPTDAELALEGCPAGAAVQPGDGQLVRADRANGDHVVWHWLPRVWATNIAATISLCQVL